MNLTGQQIKDTYEGLLNIGATGLTGALQTITDGLGNPLPMQVSDTTVNFTGIVTGIVGTTGPAGPTGAQGPIGPTGAAAPGGTSPITIEQTNSLVSTGVGATASKSLSVVIGATSCTNQAKTVVIGNQSCSLLGTYGLDTCFGAVIIGDRVCSLGNGNNATYANVAVGSNLTIGASPINPDIIYGSTITTCNNNAGGNIGVGWDINICNQYNGVLIGSYSCINGGDRAIAIGQAVVSCGGGADQLVIGQYSKSLAACAITIGRGSCSTASSAIALGNFACSSGDCSVVIGNSLSTSSPASVIIGGTTNVMSASGVNNTIINGISNCIIGVAFESVIIGGSCNTNCSARGGIYSSLQSTVNPSTAGVIIGGQSHSVSGGYYQVIVGGTNNINDGTFAFLGGGSSNCINNTATSSSIIGGDANKVCGCCSSVIAGCNNNTSVYARSVIIGGSSITADANDTVYVPNLKVTGQAASLANAIGSTGTAIAVNWDNSNVQTLTITASGTLTMSNPIDGGVYTLQITQGAGGGHTITWSNVLWPGGTPPSLSITAGAVDILTFIYGPTAYFGNANLNFS